MAGTTSRRSRRVSILPTTTKATIPPKCAKTVSTSQSRQSSFCSIDDRCPVTGIRSNISEDYHVLPCVLGSGHYGSVRECVSRIDRNWYAVKSIDKSKITRLDHLKREVYLLAKLDHEHIIKMVDCYEDENFVHIITEMYTGGELFDKIIHNTTSRGCFSEAKAASIIKSVLEAVAYLHANEIVHRDIKPENILFESKEEDSSVKLIDFGLSRRHQQGEALMSNSVGTAYYMAPELLKGAYDKACDVWSIGVIAYILICGYPPFNGETDPEIFQAIKRGSFSFPSKGWSGVSDVCKDFIKCLLRKDTEQRAGAEEALRHPWLRQSSNSKRKEELLARISRLTKGIKDVR